MFTLLRNAREWTAWQVRQAHELCLEGVLNPFGKGPREYPALVAFKTLGEGLRPSLIYVYRSDARLLFENEQEPGSTGQDSGDEHCGAHGERTLPGAHPPLLARTDWQGFVARQQEFNRWVSAHLLANAWAITGTGIATQERYEEKIQEGLALTQEIAKERSALAQRTDLDETSRTMLERFYPDDSEG